MMSIDRIEDGVATLINLEDTEQQSIHVPAKNLPHQAREGDILVRLENGTFAVDDEATKVLRKRNADLFNSLIMP